MSQPRRIFSPEDFAVKIIEFVRDCERSEADSSAKPLRPTDHCLWRYLSLSPSEFDRLSQGRMRDGSAVPVKGDPADQKKAEDAARERVKDAMRVLTAYREDRLVRQLEASKNANTNAIFQLKQAKNGGYQDVQTVDGAASVTVRIDGIGGLEALK